MIHEFLSIKSAKRLFNIKYISKIILKIESKSIDLKKDNFIDILSK